jgi:predicted nucleotidyltransferase
MLNFNVPNINERQRIPVQAIQAVANRIAEIFNPDKIILFGSYAYGDPKPWSDVDLLVVMETPEGDLAQTLAISRALSPHPFGLEIIVQSPQALDRAVVANNFFFKEILARGKTLYER